MRRLAMHHKLEPLFDKLAEMFPFTEPMDVVKRLEFLEDDKLGAFNQLSESQLEATELGAQLKQQQNKHLRDSANASEAHAQAVIQLKARNTHLQQELEAANELVCLVQ